LVWGEGECPLSRRRVLRRLALRRRGLAVDVARGIAGRSEGLGDQLRMPHRAAIDQARKLRGERL
jgi:hypothetical protein